jgi:uncharacterized protein YggE
MNAKLRIPLAVLAGGVAVAAFWAANPSESPSPGPVAAAQAAEAAADPGILAPFLRFSGTDSVKVEPDTAEISVTATETAATSEVALESAGAKLERVIAKMKELGIAQEDLQTEPAYTYHDPERNRWTANLTLRVTIDDPARAGDILGEANAAGADGVAGPYFSVEEQDAAYAEAMKKAIENARSKAEAAAQQMGVTVAGIVSVDETPGAGQPPVLMAAAAEDAAAGGEASVPTVIGPQEIFASVTVTFSYARAS